MFGVLEGELLYSTGPRWALRGLLDRFGVDLGVFGEGFGRVLGGLLGASFACCGLLWLALAALAACAFRSIATQVFVLGMSLELGIASAEQAGTANAELV